MGSRIIHGDNLPTMYSLIGEYKEKVTLAYLDPPFFTGKDFKTKDGELAYTDKWKSIDEYMGELAKRIAVVRSLLAPKGSMVLHLDSKVSHYAKVMCDTVFGGNSFASEIVWRYRRWPAKTRNFQRVHDTLLRYIKDPTVEPRFNQLYEPLAPSTVKTFGTKKQNAVIDSSGNRLRSEITESESLGVPMGDVWDIGIIAPMAKERTGYPTQKPETLLERLVLSCTDAGDIVLDPYVGSGTTVSVCQRLGRIGIGIDSSDVAVRTSKARTGL